MPQNLQVTDWLRLVGGGFVCNFRPHLLIVVVQTMSVFDGLSAGGPSLG